MDKFCKQFYAAIALAFVIVLGMPFHVATFHVIAGSYNPDVWFLPYKVMYVWESMKIIYKKLFFFTKNNKFSSIPRVRMPYDDTTRIGYFATLAIQIIAVMIIGGVISLVNTLLFGVCWYFKAFIDDLLLIMEKIDQIWCEPHVDGENKTFKLMKEFFHFHLDIIK